MIETKILEELTNAQAIAGHEEEVFQIMEKHLKDNVDEIDKDGLGSFISVKHGSNRNYKLLLAGHMDEVGFVVKKIDAKGFIFLKPVGGWTAHALLSQRLCITTAEGKKIYGVTGAKAVHVMTPEERKQPTDLDKVFLDLGVESKEEVEKLGVQIGDMITPVFDFEVMNNSKFLLAKAFDNRVGCAVIIEVMKQIKDLDLEFDVYGVATVQEEVGVRGAKTVTNKINPSLGIAIDTGIAADIPFNDENKATSVLGKGPQLVYIDSGTISHVPFRRYLEKVAQDKNIPYQPVFLDGGATDAASISVSGAGVPSLSLAATTRSLHTHSTIIHQDDFENLVKITVELIKNLSVADIEAIRK